MNYESKEKALDTILCFMFRGDEYHKPLDDGTQRNYPSLQNLESDINSNVNYGLGS